jgi:hypothetical protein
VVSDGLVVGDTSGAMAARYGPPSKLCQTRRVRRGVAGLLFFVAAVTLAVAAGGWWLQRVAFDPDSSREVAEEVLKDADVRTAIADVIAPPAASTLGISESDLRLVIDTVVQHPDGAAVLADVISDAHARVIGAGGPVEITGAQMVNIVRDERVSVLPPVVLPIEEEPVLNATRSALQWVVPVAALVGVAALILGILAHPAKADAIFGIGAFCVLAGVLAMTLGYVVPAYVAPLTSDDPWMEVIPAAAQEQVTLVAGLSIGLAILGVVLIFGSAGFRRRRSNWSSPVRVARYPGEQRRWS